MGRVIGTVVAILIGVGLFMVRSNQRADVDAAIDEMPAKMWAVCERSQDFDKYRLYLEGHADAAHQRGLDVAYSPGGRRSSPRFDPRKYATAFAESIVSQGKLGRSDPKLDLFLRQLQIDIEAAAAKGEFD